MTSQLVMNALKNGVLKIAVDAGHGRNTPGKRTPDNEREWMFNDKVLRAFVNYMKQFPNVQILRVDDPTGNTDVSLNTRTNKANAWGADIYISFHHNANTGKWGQWTGVETFVFSTKNAKAMELAKAVHSNYVQAMGLRDRGIKEANFHVTRETKMPSILLEGGYMDSTIDIKKLRDDNVLHNAGEAVAKGIADLFKLKSQEVKGISKEAAKTTAKEDDEMKFSSPSLQQETELTLGSKARREIIVKTAIKGGAHKSWLEKLEKGTITDGDILGLAAKYLIDTNK